MSHVSSLSKYYRMVRIMDVSGVSGTGTPAFAESKASGEFVLYWAARRDPGKLTDSSVQFHPHIENAVTVHGHEGATVFVEELTPEGRNSVALAIDEIVRQFNSSVRRGSINKEEPNNVGTIPAPLD